MKEHAGLNAALEYMTSRKQPYNAMVDEIESLLCNRNIDDPLYTVEEDGDVLFTDEGRKQLAQIVAAPAQGTPEPPKVEEFVQTFLARLAGLTDEQSSNVAETLTHSLRPYFPPASQTPHAERMLELIAKRVGYTNQDEGLISFIVSRLATPASTARTHERTSDGAYGECSDEAVELLATIENADYEEGCAAVFELRKLLPNLDRYVKDEVAEQIEKLSTARTDGWVSVKDGLPKVGQWCWVVYHGVVQRMAANLSGKGFACADGYEWTWADAEADPCPLEEITHWRELPAAPGSLPQAPDPLKDDSRCAICAWPLAESPEKGCVRGNCSQRPFPEVFYDLERANREYGNKFGVPARAAQPGDAPQKGRE
jgi:hypothetical protein